MSSDQLIAALYQRLERQDALLEAQAKQIAALEAELREWKAGAVGPTNRQRRRVRGAKPTKDQPDPNKKRPAGRKKGHKGAGTEEDPRDRCRREPKAEDCPSCTGDLIDKGIGHRHHVEDIVLTAMPS